MARRTQVMQQLPWTGGLNSALDSGLIPPTDLVTADNIVFSSTGVREKREGFSYFDSTADSPAVPYVRLHDFWYLASGGTSLTQKIVAVTSGPIIYSYTTGGTRTTLTNGGTAFAGTAARVCTLTFNNKLIIAFERTNNTPKVWDPAPAASTTYADLSGSPPDFSIAALHLSRIWTNDKTNRDRLHYSATGNETKWQGADDSGALDIRPGDGDPEGITGIFAFKGRLFVSKKTKMYQVVGDSPENFQVLDVSNGLGLESHGSICAVDQDDILYVSNTGVHSIATTANYGDFTGAFLSAKIQPDFNGFDAGRMKYTQTAYLANINSVAFSFAEDSSTAQDNLWLYNAANKEWYRWPSVDCQSLCTVMLNNVPTLFIGASDGKILQAQNGTYTDFTATGIQYRIKSGTIYPDQNPMAIKAFKRLSLFYRPVGTYEITVKVRIDNYSEQTFSFNQNSSGDLLDSTFILGSSVLGASAQFAPYTIGIDGYGRGITLEVIQSGTGEQIAIYGFAIEWESADLSQETVVSEEGA